jgi:ornithine carbamoyltransferase
MKKNVLSILGIKDEIEEIIDFGFQLKNDVKNGRKLDYLQGKTLALIFERASTRTRASFEVGMTLLGGHAVFLNKDDIKSVKKRRFT